MYLFGVWARLQTVTDLPNPALVSFEEFSLISEPCIIQLSICSAVQFECATWISLLEQSKFMKVFKTACALVYNLEKKSVLCDSNRLRSQQVGRICLQSS